MSKDHVQRSDRVHRPTVDAFRRIVRKLAAAAAPLCLVPASSAQGGGGPPALQGLPPFQLSRTASLDRMEVESNGYLTATARHRIHDKSVHIDYYATGSGPRDLPILANKSLTVATSYHPTAVAFLEDGWLAVAGKWAGTAGNSTVIEIWGLAVPQIVQSIPPSGGEANTVIRGARVLNRTVVLNIEEPGKAMVCAMLRVRGKPASMFVQFWDSRDLYELDFSEVLDPSTPPPPVPFPISKVLSATPGGSAPFAPDLADKRRVWVRGATHSTAGYVYTWIAPAHEQIAAGSGGVPALTLFDTDRDGDIDTWGLQTQQQNLALGLLDPTQYEEMGLCQKWK